MPCTRGVTGEAACQSGRIPALEPAEQLDRSPTTALLGEVRKNAIPAGSQLLHVDGVALVNRVGLAGCLDGLGVDAPRDQRDPRGEVVTARLGAQQTPEWVGPDPVRIHLRGNTERLHGRACSVPQKDLNSELPNSPVPILIGCQLAQFSRQRCAAKG